MQSISRCHGTPHLTRPENKTLCVLPVLPRMLGTATKALFCGKPIKLKSEELPKHETRTGFTKTGTHRTDDDLDYLL